MMSFTRFWAIFYARQLEFWRDRAVLGWNFAFPVLLIFGFSFVFSGEGRNQFKIGLLNVEQPPAALEPLKYADYVIYTDRVAADQKVAQHQIDALIDWPNQQFWINDTSPKGYLAENLLLRYFPDLQRFAVSGDAITYLDWVIPGILGMNIMFSCLFGVGYVIVRYRKNGVLKRLHATPVNAFEFILAQISARLIIVVAVSSSIFLATWLILDFKVIGSLISLLFILCLGTVSLIAMGLMIAAKSESEELTGGLLNLASWPMMFLSGVWFSLEGAPDLVKHAADLLPLTHLVAAAREVMTEGSTLFDVADHLLYLTVMTLIFFVLAGVTFSWGKNR